MAEKNLFYKDKYFMINGEPCFLFGGEMHYSRIPRGLWEDRLNKMKQCFLNTYSSYSFWNYHEKERGNVNLAELEDILGLAHNIDLHVIVRCGTYACAEWDCGGYPHWLLTSNFQFRDFNKQYLMLEKDWHGKFSKVVIPYQFPQGPVILYQVENEFFWHDRKYLPYLYKMARDLGITIPIFVNENFEVEDICPLINAIDLYPGEWDFFEPSFWMFKYMRKNHDKPRFIAELEGGWFSRYGGQLPTQRGKWDPNWTEVLTKFFIATGLNGTIMYMFDGGTNFNYWPSGGDARLTTTYDYDACIRESGELHERYYRMRLIGGFIDTFGKILVQMKPKLNYFKLLFFGIKRIFNKKRPVAFIRSLNESQFSFILNDNPNKIKNKEINFKLENIEEKKKISVIIPPKSLKIIPINIKISEKVKIEYCTAEIFRITSEKIADKNIIFLICYDKKNIKNEISIKIENESDSKILQLDHSIPICEVLNISDKNKLCVISINKDLAKKTQFFNGIPIISNIYFAEPQILQTSRNELNIELDSNKIILWIPEIASINSIKLKLLDGTDNTYEINPKSIKNGLKYFEINDSNIKEFNQFENPKIEFNKLKYKSDSEPLLIDYNDNNWKNMDHIISLEESGFYKNGFYIYRVKFSTPDIISQESFEIILNLGIRGHSLVILNGISFGLGRGVRLLNIAKLLKKGDNKNTLIILVENDGHRHFANVWERSGLTRTPILMFGKENSLKIRFTRTRKLKGDKIPLKLKRALFLPANIISKPLDKLKAMVGEGMTLSGIFGLFSVYLNIKNEGYLWYKSTFYYEEEKIEEFKKTNKRLWLMMDKVGQNCKIWLNNTVIDTLYNRKNANGFDITDLLKPGKNVLLVAMNLRGGYTILSNVYLTEGYELTDFKIQYGFNGQIGKYFLPEINTDDWQTIEDKSFMFVQKEPVGWFKIQFKIKEKKSDIICPLKLIIPKEIKGTALIFLNEKHIGRYEDIGPQFEYYLPEPWLKWNGEINDLTILVVSFKKNTVLHPDFKIKPYFTHKKVQLNFL